MGPKCVFIKPSGIAVVACGSVGIVCFDSPPVNTLNSRISKPNWDGTLLQSCLIAGHTGR